MHNAPTETERVPLALIGCLLGTAIGDALGLPREGLSRERAQRLFGPAPLRHRFLFGRGMISDDTEHTCCVAQALLRSGGEPDRFARALARELRGWLAGLPAGVGLATLKAVLKLWLGWPPERSGVSSAGNGPAMRAALLGAAVDDLATLVALVRASTRLTHLDPRAEQGARLIALAARQGARYGPVQDAPAFLATLMPHALDAGLQQHLTVLGEYLARGATAAEFADALGLAHGVSGFINHTVPVTLYCWLRYPTDFRQAVEEVILLGGDADTTGAIVGGLMGATLGAPAIPEEWLNNLMEWPRSPAWMRRLGERLARPNADGEAARPLPLSRWGLLPRNMLFAAIVLCHGFRRMLPPY